MNITDPWVLPKGLVITPVAELPEKLREQVQGRDGDFAISRPQSRTPSRIVDRPSVELLKEFETAKTIAQAVARYSRTNGSDPEGTLEDALPMLSQMISWRLLVQPGSNEAEEIRPSFEEGASLAHCEVLRCLQAIEDSEIYQVRRPTGDLGALKTLRLGSRSGSSGNLDREGAILQHLAGSVSPALLDTGISEDRRYLLLEWCAGVDAAAAAGSLQREQSAESTRRLLALCGEILRAYARLHELGVTHSDIHPRNILVDAADRVKIVDFGLARLAQVDREFGEPPRGGIGFFFEPEYAAASRQGRQPPSASQQGEQYGLAALIYFLITGAHYLEFSLTRDEMMRQILEDAPLPFAQRGQGSWPDVEQVLARALSKDPSARFGSVSDFADRLSAARVPDDGWRARPTSLDPALLDQVLSRSLARVGFSGNLVQSGLTVAPKASVTYGAAGIAYALYRIACGRQDASLLSLADVWSSRAVSDLDAPESYYNREIEITPELIGPISAYHTASGIHAVRALISHALCDVNAQGAALEAFMVASQKPCDNLDLALGRSGIVLAASLLLDTLGDGGMLPPEPLVDFGNATLKAVWEETEKQPPMREGPSINYLGIAHGWAGILYAALSWHRSSGSDLPPGLEERLRQLMEWAQPSGRGVYWPWVLPQGRQVKSAESMPGWCNGSAGYIFLWTSAHRVFHDEAYLQMAERAAWHAWESTDSINNLCCGLAGQAYGLLNLYKHTHDSAWLDRARDLACRAAAWDPERSAALKMEPSSLYKGEMGVAVLAADLSDPESACMPFFEAEGWPAR